MDIKKLSFWIKQFSFIEFYIIFKMTKIILKFIFIFIIIVASNALCSDNCIQCNQTTNQCTKCAPNFIIVNNSCQAYSCTVQHCSTCQIQNMSSCLSCEQGYNLRQNYCNESISVNVLIIVVMTFVGIILISITLVCFIHYLNKKQNEANSQQNRFKRQQQKYQGIIQDFEYNLGQTQCTICLTNQTDLILTCGHYFHLTCFSDWITKGRFCPICKSDDLNKIKLVLCMQCKNKCITGKKNYLKKLEESRITYKCSCKEKEIVNSNMILY